jgi:hypothetical protein
MTPQERQLIGELFDRLASLENGPRDPDAEAMIREGFRRAPNAAYSLVQTVLVQDEALKAANAHIQEFERANGTAPQAEPSRGFLDSMRESIFGRDEPRGSVPRVPQGGAPGGTSGGPWGQGGGQPGYQQGGYQQGGYQQGGYQQGYPGGAPGQQAPMGGGGSSFLGTAAAAAAGIIGGSLLMGGIRSAMGGHQSSSPAAGALDSLSGRGEGSPWSGNAAGSDLARDAGLGDVGGSRGSAFGGGGDTQRAGLFGAKSQAEQDAEDDAEGDAADDSDDGDYDGGDTEEA